MQIFKQRQKILGFGKKTPEMQAFLNSRTSWVKFASGVSLTSPEELWEIFKKGSSADIYCIDRYWTKMNKDNKMFIFSDKLGYQRPNYSNIKRTVSMFLD